MKRFTLLLFCFVAALHANQRAQGFCQQGGQVVVTNGQNSTTKVQQSFPSCTITVFLNNTSTLATLFSDNSGTPLSNPFSANSTGLWFFYAANGRYDVQISGGGLGSPYTFGDILLADPFSGTGPVLTWNGRQGNVTFLSSDFTSLLSGLGCTANQTLVESGACATVSGSSNLPSGTQTQYLRIQPNTGNNTTLQFASWPSLMVSDYNFPSQAPGGSLTGAGGAQAITLSPCPIGIVTTGATATPIYLSGGTGTAEVVYPSGGTCTSGAASGTIIVSPANNHSGAWTVTEASGGISSCLNSLTSGWKCIIPASSTVTVHGKITTPAINWVLEGPGPTTIGGTIARASDYPNGDLFFVPNGSVSTFSGLSINNSTVASQTSGAAIHMQGTSGWLLNNYVLSGYIGYEFEGTSNVQWVNNEWYNGTSGMFAGVYMLMLPGPSGATDTRMIGGAIYGNQATYSMRVEGADTLNIENVTFSGGTTMFSSAPQSGMYVSNVRLVSNTFDVNSSNVVGGIWIGTPHSSAVNGNYKIIGNMINGEQGTSTTTAIDICNALGNNSNCADIIIAGNDIQSWGQLGIAAGSQTIQLIIANNNILANNTRSFGSNNGGIILLSPNGAIIDGNRINGANHQYNIFTSAAGLNLSITNNDLTQYSSQPIGLTGIPAGLVLKNNLGVPVDTTIFGGAVSSASTISPTASLFHVTGTAAIGTINLPLGFFSGCITIIPDGLFTTTNAGNIAIASTAVVSKQLQMCYDPGTAKWYPSY